MTKPPALKLDEFLCFEVYSVNHAFNRVYQPLLDKLHLIDKPIVELRTALDMAH